MRKPFAVLILLVLWPAVISAARADESWQSLAPIASDPAGEADVHNVRIRCAVYGHGSPVIVLHGGLASADDLMADDVVGPMETQSDRCAGAGGRRRP